MVGHNGSRNGNRQGLREARGTFDPPSTPRGNTIVKQDVPVATANRRRGASRHEREATFGKRLAEAFPHETFIARTYDEICATSASMGEGFRANL